MPTRKTTAHRRRNAPDDRTTDLFGEFPGPPSPAAGGTDAAAARPDSLDLTLADSPQAPLNAAQRKFNRLVKRIQQGRADLAAWQAAIDRARDDRARRLLPLVRELDVIRLQVVRRLETWLDQRRWTVRERDTLIGAICSMTGSLLQSADLDEATADELAAVYDRHHDHRYADVLKEELHATRDMLQQVTGLDLPPLDDEPLDAYLARAHAQLMQQLEAGETPVAGTGAGAAADRHDDSSTTAAPDTRRSPPKRPNAAAERARLAREAAEQQAQQSLREVYRKLASALHPDRADDPADAQRRTALMQRVNQAYEAKDLLTLFSLQLEIEQIDAAHLAHATAERAAHYNHVLAQQDEELRRELLLLRDAAGLELDLPVFDLARPGSLQHEMDRRVRDYQDMLATATEDLSGLEDLAYTKRWIKETRQMFAQTEPGW